MAAETSLGNRGAPWIPERVLRYQGRPAGLVSRFAGACVDTLLVVSVVLVGYAFSTGALYLLNPRDFVVPDVATSVVIAGVLAALIGYHTVCWRLGGRTLGCVVLGLRVVDVRGRPLGLPRALARALAYAVFPLGLLWVAPSQGARSVQDLLLHTTVIYDWVPAEPSGS